MSWCYAKCDCGENITRYSAGWKHNATGEYLCADGVSHAVPAEETVEVLRFMTRGEYEAFLKWEARR